MVDRVQCGGWEGHGEKSEVNGGWNGGEEG